MQSDSSIDSVLVTGGAGYVGARLVPALIEDGYRVRVLDLYIYGDDVLESVEDHRRLQEIRGDIRDAELVRRSMEDMDAVIHLACISNDPSFELDPELGRSINYDAFRPLVEAATDAGVDRFVFASSSSVYGIKEVEDVTEDMDLEPLTDYSLFKAKCEQILTEYEDELTTLTVRPATVCGYSPRLRLDVIVNILTNHAYHNRTIKVFGGDQLRPNIHILDMVDVYRMSLSLPANKIGGEVYNAGYQNLPVREIAKLVKGTVEEEAPEKAPIGITRTPSDDERSYHVSSEKIRNELGFEPERTIEDAVRGLVVAFRQGRVPDAMESTRYYNIDRMKELDLA